MLSPTGPSFSCVVTVSAGPAWPPRGPRHGGNHLVELQPDAYASYEVIWAGDGRDYWYL